MADEENEELDNEAEDKKDKKSKKKSFNFKKLFPIFFYIAIFAISLTATFLISSHFFNQIQNQQKQFISALQSSGLADTARIDSLMKQQTLTQKDTMSPPSASENVSQPQTDVTTSDETQQDTTAKQDTVKQEVTEKVVEEQTQDSFKTTKTAEEIFEGIVDTTSSPAPFEEVVKKAKVQETSTSEPQTAEVVNIRKTLKILKSMRTDESVALLKNFDNETFAELLMQMKERNAASILAALPSERAFKLTQLILKKQQ